MKKLLLVCILAGVLFVGCGKTATNIVPADAAKTILDNVSFTDSLIEAPAAMKTELYKLDDQVQEIVIYTSGSGATPEEIAVIKTGDVKTAQAAATERVEDLKFRFQDYRPEQMPKLNDPVVVAKGDIVVLVICEDSAQAQKTVDDLFA